MRGLIHAWFSIVVAIWLLAGACSPASISRIGPSVPPRQANCEIESLKKGEKPSRPYRDVGMVALENCQDYLTLPCSEWLRKAACELGGQVAYILEGGFPSNQFGPVTFKVMVAAYVADLRYNLDNDPIYRSRTCSPPCIGDEKCVDGACRPASEADCEVEAAEKKNKENDPVERCTD
ncbi:MAG: hypothetical protein GY847_21750 [Proteobacteria bacterium]|nr:hypothetical protein [Pseudomonadota bacterium]